MIRKLMAEIHRRLLAREIRDMEADLQAIATQRANDIAAERMIAAELVVARRQMQAMNQARLAN